METLFVGDGEPDMNVMDPPVMMLSGGALVGGARAKKKTASKPKTAAEPRRVPVDGLTTDQDELLQTVQYCTGLLAGRASLRSHLWASSSAGLRRLYKHAHPERGADEAERAGDREGVPVQRWKAASGEHFWELLCFLELHFLK